MNVTIEQLSEFLFAYSNAYRESYRKATTARPDGPGYPALVTSPFLDKASLDVYIASDGVVVLENKEPNYQWYIAGGPALKVDYEPTRTPKAVKNALAANGLTGKPIGISRIVSQSTLPGSVWRGKVLKITKTANKTDQISGISLHLREVDSTVKEVVNALTFGAFGTILNPFLPNAESQIGESHLTKNMGIFPADLSNRRFFKYLEVFGHSDSWAWDQRLVSLRVQRDLRRDMAAALSDPTGAAGGTMSFGKAPDLIESYTNRLESLETAIAELREALQFNGDDVEAVFHAVLQKHPLLLDVYGTCESKPELAYPPGATSPIGKTKLQPDFLIRYPDQSYKLIEIERPAKGIATSQGQPRAEVGQAVFQTAEWKHFIKTHYQVLAKRYPGIQSKCKTSVIMSRLHQNSFKSATEARAYTGLIMEQFNIDEFLTFDDLLERAATAYALLSGLGTAN
jgi:hypothetical protein